MSFYSKRIKIIEYTNVSVVTKGKHLRPTETTHTHLEFSPLRLYYAIAMTLTKKHLSKLSSWYDCVTTGLKMRKLIASGGSEFKLIESRINNSRDFTKTTAIGEFAQGVAYLFAQENLGYPLVTDFEFFFSCNDIQLTKGMSTPDFIIQKRLDKNISLLESKGTQIDISSPIKTFLNDGLDQCKSGNTFSKSRNYPIISKYALCTEFAKDTNNKNTVLHFVDPANEALESEFDDRVMKLHYAAWFYLIGDFENANLLIKFKEIKFIRANFNERIVNDEIFYVVNHRYVDTTLFPNILRYSSVMRLKIKSLILLEKSIYVFGISKKIIDHLRGKEKLNEIPSFEFGSIDGNNVFADGTIVFLN